VHHRYQRLLQQPIDPSLFSRIAAFHQLVRVPEKETRRATPQPHTHTKPTLIWLLTFSMKRSQILNASHEADRLR
jgi:hypothetical protein